MSEGEFDIIQRYFTASKRSPRKDVLLSVGDDCAVTELNPNQHLAITTDTMVENIHFLPNISPTDLAYKAVAGNLSDLASMGAEPAWISLALTLPKIDHPWLEEFSKSFFSILDHYNVETLPKVRSASPLPRKGLSPKIKPCVVITRKWAIGFMFQAPLATAPADCLIYCKAKVRSILRKNF